MPNRPTIPSVHALMAELGEGPRHLVRHAARLAIDDLRLDALKGKVDEAQFAKRGREHLARLEDPGITPVINLTGTLLHTGLGRAKIADEAADAMRSAAGDCAVELDLPSGDRGSRQDHISWLLRELTGAEDGIAVNNCAAAVVLSLAAIARGRKVLLSRGEMVEIGGSFRMPDIIEASGATMVEVGCTNKTRLEDYEAAIDEDVAVILRCSPSNFSVEGFSSKPSVPELAALTKKHGLTLIEDVGSGCLTDMTRFGLPAERTLGDAVRDGADLAMASGDKMLGGPQAGMIVGAAGPVKRCAKNPLARAFRLDKVTLAGLSATLRLYLEEKHQAIPFLASLDRPLEEIKTDAELLAAAWPNAEVVESMSMIGGGSMPGQGVPTFVAALKCSTPDAVHQQLRQGSPAVVARIQDGKLLLDPRSAAPGSAGVVAERLKVIRGE